MSDFQPGDRVLFRLGERMPTLTPCCNKLLDTFEIVKDLSGKEYTVESSGFFIVCPLCCACMPPDVSVSGRPLTLRHIFQWSGDWYSGFAVYPGELTKVVDS